MAKARCLKTTGQIVETCNRGTLTFDDATEVLASYPTVPDHRLHVYEDGVGIRERTALELTAYDDGKDDESAGLELNTPLNKALRDVLLNLEARMVQAGVLANDPAIPAAVRIDSIAAATNEAEYTAALKGLVKSYM